MRKRTDQEILSLALRFEVHQIEEVYGEETTSLYDTIIEYSLEGDEQPKWSQKTNTRYDFTDASITEEEFNDELLEPVEKLIAKRNQNREQRLWKINEQLYEKRKKEK